ncbi:autophagy-related protein 27 [Xylariaceae sp. FL1019]|nr:autophagy-related protein 27 [Xylariaceae sp. FL1019]
MKFSTIPNAFTALLLSLLLGPANAMLRCAEIVADKQLYDLSKLGGPHSVVMSEIVDSNESLNTTYTVDICKKLTRKGDFPKDEQCPTGSRACAIKRRIITGDDKSDVILKATPLAGDFKLGGGDLEPEISKLSKVDPDSGKEGLRIIMKGGYDVGDNKVKRKQQVVIDFVCDEERDGTEGEWESEEKYERRTLTAREDEDKKGDGEKEGEDGGDKEGDEEEGSPPEPSQLGIENDPSLVFNRYGASDNDNSVDVLKLTWSSKYVCKSKKDDGSKDEDGGKDDGEDKRPSSSHWGFFTWLVVLIFLGTAAYLIFGSWLNYNRYGARGWDLLPHGDTIRDIPYLLKDWTRRVLNTVQGSGSRGGYSAV